MIALALALAATAAALLCATALVFFLVRRRDRQRTFDERRYALLESVPDAFFIVDNAWRFTHVNEPAEMLLNRSAVELIGKRIDRLLDPLASELVPEMLRARESGVPIELVQSFPASDRAVEVRIQPSADEMLVYMKDVTERQKANKRLRDGERRLRLLLQQVPAVVWTANLDVRLTSASGTMLSDYALTEAEIVGMPVDEVFCGHGDTDMATALRSVFKGESVRLETAHKGRWLRHEIEPLRSTGGAIVGAIGAALDVTEMKTSSIELERQARLDPLTGLPNRLALEEELHALLAEAKMKNGGMAVMFLDLDRFKVINDSLGHRAGDEVLRTVANRLSELLDGRARVFRPGGDEFVILTQTSVGSAHVAAMAGEILTSFDVPVTFEGRELSVSASVGASLYPDNASEPDELIQQADSAMYRAKDAGRQNAQFYSGAMHARILERMGLELDLRQALARGELQLYYQPIVDLSTERIVAAEALLRWNHPVLGEILPDRFIDIGEEIGAIVDISSWVIAQACVHAAAVRRLGLSEFRVAINLSVRDLCDAGLHDRIFGALEKSGLDAGALDVEVTESIAVNEVAVRALGVLRDRGVRVVLDDFGIGYSSLEYIKRLPVGAIKIDKTFVADVVHDDYDQAIVKAITTLAANLGLGIIAEGIETSAQRDFLRSVEAACAQGFYYSRPLSESQFLQTVKALPECTERTRGQRVVNLFR